jgi:hypothetical protein
MSAERLSRLQKLILLEIDKHRRESKFYETTGADYRYVRTAVAKTLGKCGRYGITNSFSATFCQSVNNLIAKVLVEDICRDEVKWACAQDWKPGEPKTYYHRKPDRKRFHIFGLWLTEKGLNLIDGIKDKKS